MTDRRQEEEWCGRYDGAGDVMVTGTQPHGQHSTPSIDKSDLHLRAW